MCSYPVFYPQKIIKHEIDKRNFLIAQIIEIATDRFPNNADLHILCANYYMTVKLNRVLAYRSLKLAEKAGGNLDNRFRCQAIRDALDAAADDEMNEELKKYTEFKAKKEVGNTHNMFSFDAFLNTDKLRYSVITFHSYIWLSFLL